MSCYGILMYPSYNRVYFQSSKDLAISELMVANMRLSQSCSSLEYQNIAGVDYLTFSTDQSLTEKDIEIISVLSFVYAIFEIQVTPKLMLLPVTKISMEYFSDDIVTILKYSGKTNEAFTKLMINLGFLTSQSIDSSNVHLLDPICGKGTSLFQGLIHGFHVTGIEIDKMAVQQATTFLTRYLKTKKYKHRIHETKMSENNKRICEITHYDVANTKEAFKEGQTLSVDFYRGDTLHTEKFVKKNTMDIIVGDLPYGVQHGSNTNTGSFTRNPEGLLKAALPHWHKVMKSGGSLVLSWNTFVMKREILIECLRSSGFQVLTDAPYNRFVHRVDQAIIRDLIIGIKV